MDRKKERSKWEEVKKKEYSQYRIESMTNSRK